VAGGGDVLSVQFRPDDPSKVYLSCADGSIRVHNTKPPHEHTGTLKASLLHFMCSPHPSLVRYLRHNSYAPYVCMIGCGGCAMAATWKDGLVAVDSHSVAKSICNCAVCGRAGPPVVDIQCTISHMRMAAQATAKDGSVEHPTLIRFLGGAEHAGKLLACCISGDVLLWHAPTARVLSRFSSDGGSLQALDVRKDGKQFACAGESLAVQVFDLDHSKAAADVLGGFRTSSQLLRPPESHGNRVHVVR
jgi:WD40 repeat protein